MEEAMSLYLGRGKYSQEAIKGMLGKPEDRTASVRALYEAAGAKLLHLWLLPTFEIIAIAEANQKSAASVGAVLVASGALTEVSYVELMTFEQVAEAMKGAGALAAKYRQPGT